MTKKNKRIEPYLSNEYAYNENSKTKDNTYQKKETNFIKIKKLLISAISVVIFFVGLYLSLLIAGTLYILSDHSLLSLSPLLVYAFIILIVSSRKKEMNLYHYLYMLGFGLSMYPIGYIFEHIHEYQKKTTKSIEKSILFDKSGTIMSNEISCADNSVGGLITKETPKISNKYTNYFTVKKNFIASPYGEYVLLRGTPVYSSKIGVFYLPVGGIVNLDCYAGRKFPIVETIKEDGGYLIKVSMGHHNFYVDPSFFVLPKNNNKEVMNAVNYLSFRFEYNCGTPNHNKHFKKDFTMCEKWVNGWDVVKQYK